MLFYLPRLISLIYLLRRTESFTTDGREAPRSRGRSYPLASAWRHASPSQTRHEPIHLPWYCGSIPAGHASFLRKRTCIRLWHHLGPGLFRPGPLLCPPSFGVSEKTSHIGTFREQQLSAAR